VSYNKREFFLEEVHLNKSIFAPWMISVYNWYCRETEFRAPAIKNFCQTCRIIFLWAPGLWLIQALLNLLIRVTDFLAKPVIGKFPIWGVLAVAAYTVILALYPFWVIIATGVVLLVVLIVYLFNQDGFVRVMRFLVEALITIFLLALLSFGIFWIVTNWAEFLEALILTLQIVLVLGIGALVIWVLFLGLRSLKDGLVGWAQHRRYSRKASRRPSKQVLRNVTGAFSLGWHWLVILKRKTICPWVEFTPDGHISFSFSADPPASTKKGSFGG